MALVHALAAVRREIQIADGIARTIGNDVIARLLREEFTLFRVTGAGTNANTNK
jgi:predicted ATPase